MLLKAASGHVYAAASMLAAAPSARPAPGPAPALVSTVLGVFGGSCCEAKVITASWSPRHQSPLARRWRPEGAFGRAAWVGVNTTRGQAWAAARGSATSLPLRRWRPARCMRAAGDGGSAVDHSVRRGAYSCSCSPKMRFFLTSSTIKYAWRPSPRGTYQSVGQPSARSKIHPPSVTRTDAPGGRARVLPNLLVAILHLPLALIKTTTLYHQSMSRPSGAGAGAGAGRAGGAGAGAAAAAPLELSEVQMLRAFAACKFKDFTIRKVRPHPRVCVARPSTALCASRDTNASSHPHVRRSRIPRGIHVMCVHGGLCHVVTTRTGCGGGCEWCGV